ncbi:MAG: polyprenyl synthetase family protein [Desulfurococcales archaeon]|nr:polyprenyl synthetase family protein [Desulfurococcales archaeon]
METMKQFLDKYRNLIDQELDQIVSGKPPILYNAARWLLLAGGKRIRPALALTLAHMILGQEGEKNVLPYALAVELIHNFTLIHDDIIDEDEYRRGVPTVHVKYGRNMAILAGDLLFSLSFEKPLSETMKNRTDPARAVRAMHIIARATRILAEGQTLDISFEKTWDVNLQEYLKMIYMKTGALIEAALGAAAVITGLQEKHIENAMLYGRNVGVAFQIRDDILGTFGDPAKTGKPVYNDLRKAKKTVLVIYAINNLEGEERNELIEILESKTDDLQKLKKAAELIRSSGALEYAEKLAEHYVQEAVEAIKKIPAQKEEARKALVEFAWFTVKRDK